MDRVWGICLELWEGKGVGGFAAGQTASFDLVLACRGTRLGHIHAAPLVVGIAVAVRRWTALPTTAVVSAALSPSRR